MNLDQITTKCWILALFIRDDGERLLLGDGWYDFKDSLQHFQPNNIASDIVELQGTDGQLLAGQVRRTASQSFDGYVGDALTSKTEIENRRRQFIQFFRVRRFYTVIYIFPDGTAIQRKRGYLTDAPSVPEMWQKFPEYHVALNFEDVNYYEYSEDEQGKEIYANTALIELLNLGIGGLVWDSVGAVSHGYTWLEPVTLTGDYITIPDGTAGAPLSLTELDGNATQNGTPTPDAPVAINTVTGEQVVKVAGKNLFDKSTVTAGKRLGSDGAPFSDSNFFLSDYIRVQPSTTFAYSRGSTGSNSSAIAYYTADGTFISRTMPIITNSATTGTVTSPATAYYARFCDTNANLDTAQLELGSQASVYEPYISQSQEINLGKNLLQPMTGLTNLGLTGTANPDGTITVTGTATNTYAFITDTTTQNIPSGTYTFSDGLDGQAYRCIARFTYADNTYVECDLRNQGAGRSVTLTQTATKCQIRLTNITSGSTYNLTVKPQVEVGQATAYAPYFTPIELAKIGTYQDRIYKNDGKWYIEKQTGKVIFDGSELVWNLSSGTGKYSFWIKSNQIPGAITTETSPKICDNFVYLNQPFTTASIPSLCENTNTANVLFIFNTDGSQGTTLSGWTSWLTTHHTTVYYPLATPTTTEITDETLLEQLEHIYSLYEGVNHVSITPTAGAQGTMEVKYYTVLDTTGAGYEWEPGGGSSTTTVQVTGVDNAEPIWTVAGPATNPTLTNITTGQAITWNGTVPAGQTLVVDMGNQSATLAGANVYQFISGSWITLSPGPNKLSYSATGGAEDASKLEWNGVVG